MFRQTHIRIMNFQVKLALILYLTSQTLKVNAAPIQDKNQNLQEGENSDHRCTYLNAFVEPNKIHSIEYGSCVILNCTFSEAVECAWMAETTVEVEDRYSYLEENGHNTKFCTLKIDYFQQHDEKMWKCFSMATDHQPGSAGTVFNLKGRSKPPKIENNDMHSSFECLTEDKYKPPTQLYWLMNDEKVASNMTNIMKNDISYSAIKLVKTETTVKSLSCIAGYDDDSFVQSPTIIYLSTTKGNNQHTSAAISVNVTVGIIGIASGIAITMTVMSIKKLLLRRGEEAATDPLISPPNDGAEITSENDRNNNTSSYSSS